MAQGFNCRPKTYWLDNETIRLEETLIYTDKYNEGWLAPMGLISDGKSVPRWARPVMGDPFAGDTLRASLIHDFYCREKTRSQKDTHRVFKEICLFDKVPAWKAHVMWFSVVSYNKIKNPKWK